MAFEKPIIDKPGPGLLEVTRCSCLTFPKNLSAESPRVNPGGAMIGVQNHRHAILLCYCAHVIGTTDSTSNGSMEIRVVQTFPWQNIEENGGFFCGNLVVQHLGYRFLNHANHEEQYTLYQLVHDLSLNSIVLVGNFPCK